MLYIVENKFYTKFYFYCYICCKEIKINKIMTMYNAFFSFYFEFLDENN